MQALSCNDAQWFTQADLFHQGETEMGVSQEQV